MSEAASYRRKVIALALVGYGFILSLVGLLVALGLGIVYLALHSTILLLKLLLPIVALLFTIGRSLWVRFEPPTGVVVDGKRVPALRAMVRDVGRELRGPRLHRTLLTGDANAAVAQVPRVGGLLGSRNYLLIGLPYVLALAPGELRGVVAHELGHLSRRHGRFGAFVYRVRMTWTQLLAAFEERRSMWSGAVRLFLEWYVPTFDWVALPAARAHEFEADDAAAEVAGADQAAAGLVAGMLVAQWLDETYLAEVFKEIEQSSAPPATAFVALPGRSREFAAAESTAATFRLLMEEEPDPYDTHPTLAERLERLGVEPEAALAAALDRPEETAADMFLGGRVEELAAAVGVHWAAEVAPSWQQARASVLTDRARLRQLQAATDRSGDEELERGELVHRLDGAEQAQPIYEALLGTGHDAPARYVLGSIALDRGDIDGLRLIDEAMAADGELVVPGCMVAAAYFEKVGRPDEAQAYLDRAERQLELLAAAYSEREGIGADARLAPPDLPAPVLDEIRVKVGWRYEIREAYLVRKEVELLQERPFYVLAYVKNMSLAASRRDTAEDEETLDEWLARMVDLPRADLLVLHVDPTSSILPRLTEVDGALLFRR